jgi:hypothetical protein
MSPRVDIASNCKVGQKLGLSLPLLTCWGDPGVDESIILRRIFRKWDVGVWTGLSGLKIETGGGHL